MSSRNYVRAYISTILTEPSILLTEPESPRQDLSNDIYSCNTDPNNSGQRPLTLTLTLTHPILLLFIQQSNISIIQQSNIETIMNLTSLEIVLWLMQCYNIYSMPHMDHPILLLFIQQSNISIIQQSNIETIMNLTSHEIG